MRPSTATALAVALAMGCGGGPSPSPFPSPAATRDGREVRTFSLPNSRLLVGCSTDYFRLLSDSDPPSLMPDVPVSPTIDDLLRGHDRVLEAAISWTAG